MGLAEGRVRVLRGALEGDLGDGDLLGGAQQPVAYPALPALSAVRGDGSLIWNAPLSGSGAINDALPGSPDASTTSSITSARPMPSASSL